MVDRVSASQRSENMRRIKSRDTTPELVVRRLVHSMGYRYRLHRKSLPGRPDLVFGPRQKVIFVHGCFWHQHSGCGASRVPRSNAGYWSKKLSRNVNRDKMVRAALEAAGWQVLVIWECMTKDTLALRKALQGFIEGEGEPVS